MLLNAKRLIRKHGTHSYLMKSGQWTEDFRIAQDFEDGWAAGEACEEHGITDVELVLIKEENPSEDCVTVLSVLRPNPLKGI